MIVKYLDINGKQMPVAFPVHALREIERMIGGPFLSADFLMYETRIAIAYAGLKWGLYKNDGREPKFEFNELQVADWVGSDLVSDDSINGKILEILNEWLPKPKNAEAGESPA